MHYKTLFSETQYNVKLQASSPVAVGILISFAPNQNTSNLIAYNEEQSSLIDCLWRQAILGKRELREQLLSFLNHTTEIKREITTYKVKEFFGERFMIPLSIAAIILVVVLVVYGLVDEFFFRKINFKIERKSETQTIKNNHSLDGKRNTDLMNENFQISINEPNSPR